MSDYKFVGWDTETAMIAHTTTPPLVCITFYDEETQEKLIFGRHEASAKLKEYLDDPRVVLIAQNSTFDSNVMVAHDPSLLEPIAEAHADNRMICTKLTEILLNTADPRTAGRAAPQRFLKKPGGGYAVAPATSLGGLVINYLREDITASKSDVRRISYWDLKDTPVEEWDDADVEYAVKDAIYVVEVFRKQAERAASLSKRLDVNLLSDLPRQTYVEFILNFMGMTVGVGIDPEKVEESSQALLDAQDYHITKALELGLLKADEKKYRGYTKSMSVMQTLLEEVETLIGVDMERNTANKDNPKKGIKAGDPTTIKAGEQQLKELYELIDNVLNGAGMNFKTRMFLSDEELERLAEIQVGLQAYQGAEKAWKAKSTFVDAIAQAKLNPDNRVRYSYKGLMETGRTSSARPNMQNLPRTGGVRACIKPREGYIFVQADYSNAELRTLAQTHLFENRQSRLAERYIADPSFDPHAYMAVEMFNKERGTSLSYDNAKAILGDKTHAEYKHMKHLRQQSKMANFGYAGGLGIQKFVQYAAAQNVKFTEQEAKELKEQWLSVWFEMNEYFNLRSQDTKRAGELSDRELEEEGKDYSSSVFNSIFKFGKAKRARFLRNYTIACNTPFQGLAADGAKDAIIMVFEECFFKKESPLYRSIPILFVHDELCLETAFPEDTPENRQKATAAALRLAELMELGMANHTPDVPAVAEPCLTTEWTKDAESYVRDDNTLSIYGLDDQE